MRYNNIKYCLLYYFTSLLLFLTDILGAQILTYLEAYLIWDNNLKILSNIYIFFSSFQIEKWLFCRFSYLLMTLFYIYSVVSC